MTSSAENVSYSQPDHHVPLDAALFDMDGTIVDSTDAVLQFWHMLGQELGVDSKQIMIEAHGRRTIETVGLYDKNKANWDYVCEKEALIPKRFGQNATEIPGARNLLKAIDQSLPWTIVTSGTRSLVGGWLELLKLAQPPHLVTAEDVSKGKPDPECYQLGRQRLGMTKSDLSQDKTVVVFEDSPAGIRAGVAAGCKVVAVATTHSVQRLADAGAHWIVKDLDSISFKVSPDSQKHNQLVIRNALQI